MLAPPLGTLAGCSEGNPEKTDKGSGVGAIVGPSIAAYEGN